METLPKEIHLRFPIFAVEVLLFKAMSLGYFIVIRWFANKQTIYHHSLMQN